MKTKFLKCSYAIIIAALFATACDYEDRLSQGTEDEEEQALVSASVGEDASDDALEITTQAEAQFAVDGGRAASFCGTVTKDKENKILTIDFGDGCVGPYGRERKGKIFIAYSSTIGDNLANRIITFDNYFVNNKGVGGTIELRDISINDAGNLQSVKRLIALTISFPNGEQIEFNGSRTRELISGYADEDPFNNIYKITGSVTGTSTAGRSFTHQISEPIIADWSCAARGNFPRVSGKVEMTRLGGYQNRMRIVDYGNGDCDNIITITTFRRTYTVTAN
ncbi:MAG: hypothetical protein WKF87_02100 [Chryseolinea sp.]